MNEAPPDVTALLAQWADDDSARERLIDSVYAELRQLARSLMGAGAAAAVTLQPTAVVNEALIKLLGNTSVFEDRRHFFGSAARAMRQVLVDHFRRKQSEKRGGDIDFTSLELAQALPVADVTELMALDEALSRLDSLDAQAARIVELRYFAGLTLDETADVLGIHPATVSKEWAHARAWLKRALQ
ncbi:ECF-type sigma factor [Pseudomarimonas arenosa]|uniref:Sigma-70 family RNA polymerase sigma factor n=1 Tax=Pseudomarimonas arenosa TaxID=2774145 RepID=A0AAW3ZJY2_9GAMM|nr:ECF-type sigma factor [Pseudomarimonas arenosa]MBD8524601.1 sigma-70 family RNA polymerase sigma factor [Pseudomarimonas arenosa]